MSNFNKLIDRARYLNSIVWESNNSFVKQGTFDDICRRLFITLPNDFVKINSQIRYDCSSIIQFFLFDAPEDSGSSIIENNLYLRKQYAEQSDGQSDMSHILVLADDDGGSVFMITQDSPEKPTPIIWCDYGDMYYYSIHKKFQYPHDEWPSFTAFFEYLVEREEEALKEDGGEID